MKVILLIALVCLAFSQTCTNPTLLASRTACPESKVDNLIQQFKDLGKNYIENAEGAFEGPEVNKFNQDAFALFGQLATCFPYVQSFYGGIREKLVTINSDLCPTDNETIPEFKNDPCCNEDLQDKECCARRPRKYKMEFATFNQVPDKCCKSPNKIKALIRNFNRLRLKRQGSCQGKFKKGLGKVIRRTKQFHKCFRRLFQSTQQCETDDDCDGDIGCDILTSKCAKLGFNDPKAISNFVSCILSKFDKQTLAALKDRLDLPLHVNRTVMSQVIFQNITNDICVDRRYGFFNKNWYTTQAACEGVQVCNDGTANCKDLDNFCGVACGFNDIHCTLDLAAIHSYYNNSANCIAIGECSGLKEWDKTNATCTALYQCSDFLGGNQTDCLNRTQCPDWPFRQGICVKARKKDGECVDNDFDYEGQIRRCIKEDNINGTVCQQRGGQWVMPPSNPHDCLKYKLCILRNHEETNYNSTECFKCKGNYKSIFKTRPTKWRRRAFIPRGKWKPRAMIQENKWTKSIDFSKVIQFANAAVAEMIKPLFVSFYQCSWAPYFKGIKSIACDCAATPGTNCFASHFPAASHRIFANTSSENEFEGGSVNTYNNSYGAKATVEIVEDEPELTIDEPTKRNFFKAYATAVIPVSSGSTTIGSIVGSGRGLGSSPANAVELCLAIDSQYQIGSGHTKNTFAVKSGNGYVATTNTITSNSNNEQICADVSDTRIYFPAKIDNTVTVECDANKYKMNGVCTDCGCDATGSDNLSCDSNGKCVCKTGYSGDKCATGSGSGSGTGSGDGTTSASSMLQVSMFVVLSLIVYLF